jgi:hypothetical protein
MVLCSHQHYTKLIDRESRIPTPRFGHVKQNPSRKRRKEEKGEDSLTADLPCITVVADLPCVAVADIGYAAPPLRAILFSSYALHYFRFNLFTWCRFSTGFLISPVLEPYARTLVIRSVLASFSCTSRFGDCIWIWPFGVFHVVI